MMRDLLDTNIISNTTMLLPLPSLLTWMSEQADEDLLISTLSIAEIRHGILQLHEGRKRRELSSGSRARQDLKRSSKILSCPSISPLWAQLMAEGTVDGRPRSALDMISAAIAGANACILVTDNEKDFRNSVEVMNPIRPASLQPERLG